MDIQKLMKKFKQLFCELLEENRFYFQTPSKAGLVDNEGATGIYSLSDK